MIIFQAYDSDFESKIEVYKNQETGLIHFAIQDQRDRHDIKGVDLDKEETKELIDFLSDHYARLD